MVEQLNSFFVTKCMVTAITPALAPCAFCIVTSGVTSSHFFHCFIYKSRLFKAAIAKQSRAKKKRAIAKKNKASSILKKCWWVLIRELFLNKIIENR